jgi:hypothetical protein
MSARLIVGFVEVAFDGRVLDGAVHPLDLTVGPGMLGLGQPMIDVVEGAGIFEGMREEGLPVSDHVPDFGRGPGIASGISEVGSVVGEDGIDPVRDGGDQAAQEVPRGATRHLLMQFDEGELRRSVDGDDEVELALRSSNLGDVDMEIADRVGLELALGRGFAFDLRQPRDPMALKASMQRRAPQMRNRRLKRVEAVVERQQRMPSECNDDGLFLC